MTSTAWAPLSFDEFTALVPGSLVWVEIDEARGEYVAAEVVARLSPDEVETRVLGSRFTGPTTRRDMARKVYPE